MTHRAPSPRSRPAHAASFLARVPGVGIAVPSVAPAVALVVALAVALAAAPAYGQDAAPMDDFPVERFRLAMDPGGIIDVEWGAVPGHASWDLCLWLGAAGDPLVLDVAQPGGGTRERALVSHQIAGAIAVSAAMWDRAQLAVTVPLILDQGRGDVTGVMTGALAGAGVGDVAIAAKVQLLRRHRHGVDLAVLAAVTAPSASGESFRGERGPSAAPEVAISRAIGPWRLAGNAGYRVRDNGAVLTVPADLDGDGEVDESLVVLEVEDELFARLGLGYRLDHAGGPPVELAGSLSAATAASRPLHPENQNHLELLVGGSYDAPGPLVGVFAAGLGLNQGFGTPDWRVVLGVRVGGHRDLDPDHDAVLGRADACPGEPEDRDGFEDSDGCPDPDNDGDGVPDRVDRAPDVAEDRDGYADDDGAPDLDNDGDGLLDEDDRCPLEAEVVNGHADDDGCPDEIPDSDGDGLADDRDRCPAQAEDGDGFEDDDGCPDPDNDRDGVADASDRCAGTPGAAGNLGCPDLDGDGDGVVDRLDNCPDEPGRADRAGCVAAQRVRLEAGKLALLEPVYFRAGSAVILPRSRPLLRDLARVLNAHPEIAKVDVEGHYDDGTRELSRHRAEAVAEALIAAGVAASRLTHHGFGLTRPLTNDRTRAAQAANRRIEITVTDRGPR